MGIWERWFGANSSDTKASDEKPPTEQAQQAVLVHLCGTGLPDDVYESCDLATIEDQLTEVISQQELGEFDGNEVGPTESTLFMYGPDAERLFAAIEPVLRAYPLCQRARVEIRLGGPGAPTREVRL
jgi:hypothetical protein